MSPNNKQAKKNMSDFFKQTQKRKRDAKKKSVSTKTTPSKTKKTGIAKSPASKAKKPVKKHKKTVLDTRKLYTLLSIGAVFIAALILTFFLQKNAIEISVGSEIVGIVKAKELKTITEEDVLNTVKKQIEAELGTGVTLSDAIQFKPVHSSKTVNYDYILPRVRDAMAYKLNGSVFMVDGVSVAVVKSRTEADEVVNALTDAYVSEDAVEVERELINVDIVERPVDTEEVVSKEKAIEILSSTTQATQSYTIASGDRLSNVAVKHGMTLEALMEANPSISDPGRIRQGQEINVIAQRPLVSVKVTETIKRTEVIPKTVEQRKDETQYTTYSKVLQQGADGEKEVTIQTVKIDGAVQSSQPIAEDIIKEPTTEIVVVGTKTM